MPEFWEGLKVVVTGGTGFLGRVIVEKLTEQGAIPLVPTRNPQVSSFARCDLTNFRQTLGYMERVEPHLVIHCAAYYGGIWINKMYPGEIYFKNLIMGANVIEACRQARVPKFVGVGTACSYPGYLVGELKEEDLWSGPCHESVRNYGMTKKMMQVQCEAYKKQYDFSGIHLLLANLYGEWDSYNPERSHVVAALIRKFVEAKMKQASSVEVWGSGTPIREFLYVRDAAEGIIRAAKDYDDVSPVNIGTGVGTSIKELVEAIAEITEFDGEIIWDRSKPDGQLKKIFDIRKMEKELGWKPETSLKEGLQHTIKWFVKNYTEAIKRW